MTIFIQKSGAGKLLFEPGLIRAVEDENLLDTDHEGQLIHEINILLFIGSLYMMLKIMWMVQNVSLRFSFRKSHTTIISINIIYTLYFI